MTANRGDADYPITPTRIARLESVFSEALDLPETRRQEFVEQRTTDDPAFRAEVFALLAAHSRADATIDKPLYAAPDNSSSRLQGTRLGAYEVGQQIGEGGMGVVHEAIRADDQYRQRVAVKFLHRYSDSGLAVQRFRVERQILATLQHPNIASLVDGGVTPDGRPYFVMEYIDGEIITRWCDAHTLDIAERLKLFRQVCAAVSAAHRKLVVHRDIKPGNMLVTSDGTVKLLDFGIAKLLSNDEFSDVQSTQPVTQVGQRAYTPDYASPEQVRGLSVDTSADVYSLGVVLFELLTGQRPFALQGKHLAEVERIVCEQPAPRPSTMLVAGRHAQLNERSDQRAQRRIEGDLDAVILKALRKEPARRYASVDELSLDVSRHLDGLPVDARPDGLGYRAGKLVRRRKLETAAIVVAIASLVGGTAAALRQAHRAEQESTRATEVTKFLTTMLGASNPETFGKDIKMREVLDSAANRVDSLKLSPELEGEIRAIIGGTYLGLGEYEAAEPQLRRDVVVRKLAAPNGDYATGVALSRLSLLHESAGRYELADSLLDEAEKIYARFPHPTRIEEGSALENRARVMQHMGRNAEAIVLLRKSLALHDRYYMNNDSAGASTYINAAVVTSDLGNNAEADTLSAKGLEAAQRAFGENSPLVASALSVRSTVLERMDRMDESTALQRKALDVKLRLLGPTHPDYAISMFNYADHLLRREKWRESAEWSRKVLALRGKTLDDTHPAIAVSMQYLGRALVKMDSLEAGEELVRESLELRRKLLPKGHWLVASSESVLGEVLASRGRYGEAERLLVPAESLLAATRGEKTQVVRDVRKRLVGLYHSWGKPADEARWQTKLLASAP